MANDILCHTQAEVATVRPRSPVSGGDTQQRQKRRQTMTEKSDQDRLADTGETGLWHHRRQERIIVIIIVRIRHILNVRTRDGFRG